MTTGAAERTPAGVAWERQGTGGDGTRYSATIGDRVYTLECHRRTRGRRKRCEFGGRSYRTFSSTTFYWVYVRLADMIGSGRRLEGYAGTNADAKRAALVHASHPFDAELSRGNEFPK